MEAPVSTGTIIDGTFEVIRPLGAGSAATVYLAKHLTMNQMVAVKVLNELDSDNADSVKRFQSEAIAIAKLDYEHIVKVLRTGTWSGRPYICMEYLEGHTLDQRMQQGSIEASDVRRIGVEICDALAHAHENGIIHRDVKPSNILLCGPNKSSKLTDFGIAKLIHQDNQVLTATGEILGTPAYMSPEQLLNKTVDQRADVYSLACVLYQCVTGHPPFSGDSAYQVAQSHISEAPKPIHHLGDLNKVLSKALAKLPDERFQSASEFKKALQSVQTEVQTKTKTVSFYTIAIAVVAGIILLAGLLAAFNHRNSQTGAVESRTIQASQSTFRSVSLKDFQDIIEKLKRSHDEAEKAKLLKEAYSFVESAGGKTLPRASRLNVMHEFATLLLNHHLTAPALKIFEDVLSDIKKNDLPKATNKKEDRFGRSNFLNCQSKAIEIYYKHGELTKAKSLYKELQREATHDSPALLKAAILLEDKKTITQMSHQKPDSDNASLKIANIFLENDLIDELGSFLTVSVTPISKVESFTENKADLMIVQAKYALLRNEKELAVELVRKFSAAKTPHITKEKRDAILQRCIEIMCVAGEYMEARSLLVSLRIPDGPTAKFPPIAGVEITDANVVKMIESLHETRKFQSARELADYVLSSRNYSYYSKATCAQLRSKLSFTPGVYAYYVCLAQEYSTKLAPRRENAYIKLLAAYFYADRIKELDLHSLAEPIFLSILNQYDLAKTDASNKTYAELSLANELQLLANRKHQEKAEVLLRKDLPKLNNPSRIDVFIPLLIQNQDELTVKKLIAECTHFHDLVWTAERSLDIGRRDLALLCLKRIGEIPPEYDALNHPGMRNCCRTIVGALCELYVGDEKSANKYFSENKNTPEDLDDFSKTYKVLKSLGS